jgi:uncharacterized repeat protein (TIGR02543 family)
MNVDDETSTVTEWYARGIGVVKSVIADSDGDPETSMELVKIGQGDGKLSISVTPKDGGTVSSDPNQSVFPAGTNVILTAVAADGYIFKGWTGDAVGTMKRTSVAAVGNIKVTAEFVKFDDLLAMVPVEGGTFTMGCTPEQGSDCDDNEKPSHRVTVGNFQIGKYEVTQALWTYIMGDNPSKFQGSGLPVERVSWNDIQKFIKKLNEQTGKKYRLPTEAEWEYAARGGNKSKGYKYSGSNNIKDVAWYYENSGDKALDEKALQGDDVEWGAIEELLKSNKNRTHLVGTKSPNELGIYDMTGNVREWVSDLYGSYSSEAQTNPTGPLSGVGPSLGPFRVNRGGYLRDDARDCRISARQDLDRPDIRFHGIGFRLALSP